MSMNSRQQDLLRWSESLAGIARTGLGFTESEFEAERYEEILAIAADIRADAGLDGAGDSASGAGAHRRAGSDDGPDPNATVAEWLRLVGSGVAGYVTPKVAIGAVVGDDEGRLLLIQRADSGVWLYPTGWADIGYSPAEVAVKEVREETGIACEVVRPLAIIDGMRAGFSRIPLYSLVFHCRATGGALAAHPQECLDVGWFERDNLPEPLASGDQWKALAFRAIDGEQQEMLFDQPRQDVWRDPQRRRPPSDESSS